MSKPTKPMNVLVALALSVSALAVGCDKEGVEQKQRELRVVKKDIVHATESLKTTVSEQAERAKEGVAKLNDKLPAVKDDAREGLENAKEGLRETRDKVVDSVKSTLKGASETVDETVEKARNAGD